MEWVSAPRIGIRGSVVVRPDTRGESTGWPSAAQADRCGVFGYVPELAVRAAPWAPVGDRVGFVVSAGPLFRLCGLGAGQREGLVVVSETYTAVYERDGEAWAVRIAEEPDVHVLCPSVPEARESIRDALGRRLGTDSTHLRIVDNFPLPAQIRSAQQWVKATRTDSKRTQMMASMTDPRSAMDWAEDLGVAMRDPVTVQALMDLGDKPISVDTFCHTITMAEELSRLSAADDCRSRDAILDKD